MPAFRYRGAGEAGRGTSRAVGPGRLKGPRPAVGRGRRRDAARQPAAAVPDDVVLVPQVEFLPVLPGAVNHADPRHEVDDLLGRRVVEVVAALVTPVTVDPLQPQVAARRAPVSHVPPPPPTGYGSLPPETPREGGDASAAPSARLSARCANPWPPT